MWPGSNNSPTVSLAQVAIDMDLTNVFDPTGVYTGAPFPGSRPPRVSGPDGRPEIWSVLNLQDPQYVIESNEIVLPSSPFVIDENELVFN